MPHAFLNPDSQVHVQQRCTKVAFPSRSVAMKAARTARNPIGLIERGEGTLRAYRCDICRQWHLGHLTKHGRKR